ncbi:hypothetical protein C8035_v005926 [Colletotrichum spinosum]|uniref:F-box domain-containing protein n=1 Tax=Colletotrichum spinosum TaxID=1347390 RepID=A0A4R8Q2Y0_9PEZI|nr:hypothetical protein C8035_v005926 [Colletotrichum spinosum]
MAKPNVLKRIWPLGKLKRKAAKPPKQLGLLDFPPEIVLMISEHLELYDLRVLSQTNRVLRKLTYRDWGSAFEQSNNWQQLEYLSRVARHSATDRYACSYCYTLHPMPRWRARHLPKALLSARDVEYRDFYRYWKPQKRGDIILLDEKRGSAVIQAIRPGYCIYGV